MADEAVNHGFTVRIVRALLTTEAFDTWLSDLQDGQRRARIQARIDRAAAGNLGTAPPLVRVCPR